MKALVQRVSQAAVVVDGNEVGSIEQGLLVFLGIEKQDSIEVVDKLLEKIIDYRIFSDSNNKMNLSVRAINGGILLVSQFTLVAQTTKGLRPSFSSAAPPKQAEALYDYFCTRLKATYEKVATGIFAADMQITLTNDGPVTFLLEENA